MSISILDDGALAAPIAAALGVPLARDLRGARVVVSCAASDDTLARAIAARAHYIDVGAAQGWLRAAYENHEAAARRANVCAVPGMCVDVAPGDWAAALVAAALPGDAPLDEIAIAHLGLDRSTLAAAGERGVAWVRDRWDDVPAAGERRRINADGVEREVVAFPSGEAITVPRHVDTRAVRTFHAPEGGDWVARTTALLAPALPFLARVGLGKLAPPPDPRPRDWQVHAHARRGFDDATVTVSGHGDDATTIAIAAYAARALDAALALPSGVLAPAEAFEARAALADLGLAVRASFLR